MATPSVSPFNCRAEEVYSRGTTRTETASWLPFRITTSMPFNCMTYVCKSCRSSANVTMACTCQMCFGYREIRLPQKFNILSMIIPHRFLLPPAWTYGKKSTDTFASQCIGIPNKRKNFWSISPKSLYYLIQRYCVGYSFWEKWPWRSEQEQDLYYSTIVGQRDARWDMLYHCSPIRTV